MQYIMEDITVIFCYLLNNDSLILRVKITIPSHVTRENTLKGMTWQPLPRVIKIGSKVVAYVKYILKVFLLIWKYSGNCW